MFSMALMQALGLVESLLKRAQRDRPVRDTRTVCRRQSNFQLALTYRPNSGELHLLMNSTGIKFFCKGEGKCKKLEAEYLRQWSKVHLGIDVQRMEVRAVEVTDNNGCDAPVLPQLMPLMQ